VDDALRGHPAIRLRGAAHSLADARQRLRAALPDVLMVDLGLPDGNGIELIREVSARGPGTDILVVTVFGDEAHVIASLEAGATGYLLKRSQPEALAQTILELREGGSPISPIIARQLLTRFRRGTSPGAPVSVPAAVPDGHLSERELEVLTYIAKGFTVNEIADMLALSAHTIATHVKRIYRKLCVHSRAEAFYEATRLGLL
jgi:DNA-binding NarL/FixJ family response regulator